jgi:hypothetical protein
VAAYYAAIYSIPGNEMSSRHTALFLIAMFMLACGCVKEAPSPQKAPPPPRKPAAKPDQKKLILPEPKKPEPVAADKVVHLVYTSNVAGEAEPCG